MKKYLSQSGARCFEIFYLIARIIAARSDFNKITAGITGLCFLISAVISPAALAINDTRIETAKYQQAVNDLIIPQNCGRITDVRNYHSKQVVIDIQDLHCHAEVQRNISRILKSLDDNYSLDEVFLEGGYGKIDTSWLCDIRDKSLRQKLVEDLVDQGMLTGGELFSVAAQKPGVLRGLDDEAMHKGNIVRLGRIIEKKDHYKNEIAELSSDLDTMKRRYFTLKNRKFNEIIEKYRKNEISSRKFHTVLFKLVRTINADREKFNSVFHIDTADYPNLCLYRELEDSSKRIRYNHVASQLKDLLQILKAKLPYKAYNALLKKTDNFQNTDELFISIAKISKAYNLELRSRYPDLSRFLDHTEKNLKINPVKLIEEEKRLTGEIRAGLSENVSEREVSFLSDFFIYFQDFMLNSISAADYDYFNAKFGEFQTIWNKYAFKDGMGELEEDFKFLKTYYEINCRRNVSFLNNMGLLEETVPGGANVSGEVTDLSEELKHADLKVIVTGGFHTEGLRQYLDERKITYIAVTPNVTQDTKLSANLYTELAKHQAVLFSRQALGLALVSNGAENIQIEDKGAIVRFSLNGQGITLKLTEGMYRIVPEEPGAMTAENAAFMENMINDLGVIREAAAGGALIDSAKLACFTAAPAIMLRIFIEVIKALPQEESSYGLIWKIATDPQMQNLLTAAHQNPKDLAALPDPSQSLITDIAGIITAPKPADEIKIKNVFALLSGQEFFQTARNTRKNTSECDVYVYQKQGALVAGKGIIATSEIAPCIGLVLYDPKIKAGGVFHFDALTKVGESLGDIVKKFKEMGSDLNDLQAEMIGGDTRQSLSKSLITDLREGMHGLGIRNIVDKDTLGHGNKRSVALNVETGEILNYTGEIPPPNAPAGIYRYASNEKIWIVDKTSSGNEYDLNSLPPEVQTLVRNSMMSRLPGYRGGRWPILQGAFNAVQNMVELQFGKKAGIFAGQALVPAIVEDLLFVCGAAFIASFVLSVPIFWTLPVFKAAWHLIHAVNAVDEQTGERKRPMEALKTAFSMEKFAISSLSLIMIDNFSSFDPTGITLILSVALAMVLPHVLVNFASYINVNVGRYAMNAAVMQIISPVYLIDDMITIYENIARRRNRKINEASLGDSVKDFLKTEKGEQEGLPVDMIAAIQTHVDRKIGSSQGFDIAASMLEIGDALRNYWRHNIGNFIERQFADRQRGIVELISNSLDASEDGSYVTLREGKVVVANREKGITLEAILSNLLIPTVSTKRGNHANIGRFGVGFLSVLAYLREENDSMEIVSFQDGKSFKITFKNIGGRITITEIEEDISYIPYAGYLHDFNNEIPHDGLQLSNARFDMNGTAIIINSKTMDGNECVKIKEAIKHRFQYWTKRPVRLKADFKRPKQVGDDMLMLATEFIEREKFVPIGLKEGEYDEILIDENGISAWKKKGEIIKEGKSPGQGKIFITMQGVLLKEITVPGMNTPSELVINLPASSSITTSRDKIIVTKELVEQIMKAAEDIRESSFTVNEKIAVLNSYLYFLSWAKEFKPTLVGAKEEELKTLVEEIIEDALQQNNAIMFLPDMAETVRYFGKSNPNVVYVNPRLLRKMALPGARKETLWLSGNRFELYFFDSASDSIVFESLANAIFVSPKVELDDVRKMILESAAVHYQQTKNRITTVNAAEYETSKMYGGEVPADNSQEVAKLIDFLKRKFDEKNNEGQDELASGYKKILDLIGVTVRGQVDFDAVEYEKAKIFLDIFSVDMLGIDAEKMALIMKALGLDVNVRGIKGVTRGEGISDAVAWIVAVMPLTLQNNAESLEGDENEKLSLAFELLMDYIYGIEGMDGSGRMLLNPENRNDLQEVYRCIQEGIDFYIGAIDNLTAGLDESQRKEIKNQVKKRFFTHYLDRAVGKGGDVYCEDLDLLEGTKVDMFSAVPGMKRKTTLSMLVYSFFIKGDDLRSGDMRIPVENSLAYKAALGQVEQSSNYQDPEEFVFIRELIQNAADAVNAGMKRGTPGDEEKAKKNIHIRTSRVRYGGSERMSVSVQDPMGMDIDGILNYLLIPNRSSKPELPGDGDDKVKMTGFFGHGFFTVFKDAEAVRVKTSKGGSLYTIELKPVYDGDNGDIITDVQFELFEEPAPKKPYKGTTVTWISRAPFSLVAWTILDAKAEKFAQLMSYSQNDAVSVTYRCGSEEIKVADPDTSGNLLGEFKAGPGKIRVYASGRKDNAVTQNGLFVCNFDRKFIEEMVGIKNSGIVNALLELAAYGIVVELPSEVKLTRDRGYIVKEDLDEIRGVLVGALLDGLVHAVLQGKQIKGLHYDFITKDYAVKDLKWKGGELIIEDDDLAPNAAIISHIISNEPADIVDLCNSWSVGRVNGQFVKVFEVKKILIDKQKDIDPLLDTFEENFLAIIVQCKNSGKDAVMSKDTIEQIVKALSQDEPDIQAVVRRSMEKINEILHETDSEKLIKEELVNMFVEIYEYKIQQVISSSFHCGENICSSISGRFSREYLKQLMGNGMFDILGSKNSDQDMIKAEKKEIKNHRENMTTDDIFLTAEEYRDVPELELLALLTEIIVDAINAELADKNTNIFSSKIGFYFSEDRSGAHARRGGNISWNIHHSERVVAALLRYVKDYSNGNDKVNAKNLQALANALETVSHEMVHVYERSDSNTHDEKFFGTQQNFLGRLLLSGNHRIENGLAALVQKYEQLSPEDKMKIADLLESRNMPRDVEKKLIQIQRSRKKAAILPENMPIVNWLANQGFGTGVIASFIAAVEFIPSMKESLTGRSRYFSGLHDVKGGAERLVFATRLGFIAGAAAGIAAVASLGFAAPMIGLLVAAGAAIGASLTTAAITNMAVHTYIDWVYMKDERITDAVKQFGDVTSKIKMGEDGHVILICTQLNEPDKWELKNTGLKDRNGLPIWVSVQENNVKVVHLLQGQDIADVTETMGNALEGDSENLIERLDLPKASKYEQGSIAQYEKETPQVRGYFGRISGGISGLMSAVDLMDKEKRKNREAALKCLLVHVDEKEDLEKFVDSINSVTRSMNNTQMVIDEKTLEDLGLKEEQIRQLTALAARKGIEIFIWTTDKAKEEEYRKKGFAGIGSQPKDENGEIINKDELEIVNFHTLEDPYTVKIITGYSNKAQLQDRLVNLDQPAVLKFREIENLVRGSRDILERDDILDLVSDYIGVIAFQAYSRVELYRVENLADDELPDENDIEALIRISKGEKVTEISSRAISLHLSNISEERQKIFIKEIVSKALMKEMLEMAGSGELAQKRHEAMFKEALWCLVSNGMAVDKIREEISGKTMEKLLGIKTGMSLSQEDIEESAAAKLEREYGRFTTIRNNSKNTEDPVPIALDMIVILIEGAERKIKNNKVEKHFTTEEVKAILAAA